MEDKTSIPLSGDAMERKIDELLSAMKGADPAELENVKSIIRKKVPFFTRSAFAAYLLKLASGEKEAKTEQRERRPRPERKPAERNERREEARKPQNQTEKSERPETIIPEGAKTLYLNVGKMKHLYAKDLSKLLQAELGIARSDIYQIRVHDKYSFVTMSEENCNKAIEKLNNSTINGRTAKVTYSEK